MPSIPKLNKAPGHTTIFTEKTLKEIAGYIQEGIPHAIAAECAGMSYDRFKVILRQGRLDLHHNVDSMHSRLVKSLATIFREHIISRLHKIENDLPGAHGAQWYLERKFWKYFSSKAENMELAEEIEELKTQLREQKEENYYIPSDSSSKPSTASKRKGRDDVMPKV